MNKRSIALSLVGVFVLASWGLAQKKTPTRPEEKQLLASFQGPELYRAYCATCHGKDAKGNGPTAPSLKVAPPDLTGIALRNGGTYPFERVQRIISGEEQTPGSHGNREMPVWGPLFSELSWDQDLGRVRVYVLAKYLEGLQK